MPSIWLKIRSGEGPERTVKVRGDRFVIGRDHGCDLQLSDAELSRRHAFLNVIPGSRVEVHDLDSRNGTFLNGRRIERTAVAADGDEIRVGLTTLVVSAERTDDRAPAGAADSPVVHERPGSADPAEPDKPTEVAWPSAEAEPTVEPEPIVVAEPTVVAERPAATESAVRRILQRSLRRVTLVAAAAGIAAAIAAAGLVYLLFLSDDESKQVSEPAPTIRDAVAAATPSVALINTLEDGFSVSGGSGSVIDSDEGLVLTNEHVVASGNQVEVMLGDDRHAAEVVAIAPCEDLALLRLDDSAGLDELPLGNQADLQQGDPVVALGFPGNASVAEELQTTSGSISVVETKYDVDAGPDVQIYPNVIQTDAAINSGNSGGPLVNIDGELVGVNSIILSSTTDQNYAVGVDLVKEVLDSLRDGRGIGWLGFGFLATAETVAHPAGLQVGGAIPGTAAAELGFGRDDVVVTAIDGRSVSTFRDYCAAVEGFESGDSVPVEYSGPTGSNTTTMVFE